MSQVSGMCCGHFCRQKPYVAGWIVLSTTKTHGQENNCSAPGSASHRSLSKCSPALAVADCTNGAHTCSSDNTMAVVLVSSRTNERRRVAGWLILISMDHNQLKVLCVYLLREKILLNN